MTVHVAYGNEFLADSLERSFTIRLPVFATPISNSIVSADGYASKYIFLVDDPADSIVFDLSYIEKKIQEKNLEHFQLWLWCPTMDARNFPLVFSIAGHFFALNSRHL